MSPEDNHNYPYHKELDMVPNHDGVPDCRTVGHKTNAAAPYKDLTYQPGPASQIYPALEYLPSPNNLEHLIKALKRLQSQWNRKGQVAYEANQDINESYMDCWLDVAEIIKDYEPVQLEVVNAPNSPTIESQAT